MRVFTAHLRGHSPPRLVREGFSWGALLFGPLWLLAHRAWLAGVLAACAEFAAALAPAPLRGLLIGALAWIFGVFGNDLRRWALARAGYVPANVIAAPDAESALARLLAARPELVEDMVR